MRKKRGSQVLVNRCFPNIARRLWQRLGNFLFAKTGKITLMQLKSEENFVSLNVYEDSMKPFQEHGKYKQAVVAWIEVFLIIIILK